MVRRLLLLSLVLLVACADMTPRPLTRSVPDAADLLRAGGQAYAAGDCQRAIDIYVQLIEQVPDDIDSMLKIAQCTYRQGDTTGAMAQYQRILRIAPRFRPAHYNLLYLQLNALVETTGNVLEAVPPESEDEIAMVQLATQIMSAVTEQVNARAEQTDSP